MLRGPFFRSGPLLGAGPTHQRRAYIGGQKVQGEGHGPRLTQSPFRSKHLQGTHLLPIDVEPARRRPLPLDYQHEGA